MKSNWFKVSVALVAVLIVAFAITSGYAANSKNGRAPAKQLPKLLDLGATKCVPCKMMVPVLDELAKDYKGQLDVQFIDVWKDPDSAKKYKVQSIPTQIFFDAKGKEVFRHVGYFPKDDIVKAFKDHGIKLKEPAKPKK